MKRISLIAALIFCTVPVQAQDVGTLDTTVKNIILTEKPMISFASAEYQYLYEATEKQVTAIFTNHIKPEVHSAMYQTLPFAANEILLKVSAGQTLEQEITTEGHLSTNFDGLNRLIAKYDISTIKAFSFPGMYILKYKMDENPRLLAKELAEIETIEWAETNSRIGGGGASLQKLSHILYVINVGWGDCEAGCIHSSRTYIEAYAGNGETQFIGRGGDELDPLILEKLFLDL